MSENSTQKNEGKKIPLYTMEVFCFTFFPQDGTLKTFLLITILKSFKGSKNFLFSFMYSKQS